MADQQLILYPDDTLRKLDFPFILEKLQAHCSGDLGITYLQEQTFSTDVSYLEIALKQVAEFKEILESDPYFPEKGFLSLPFLSRAAIAGASLSETEFVKVASFLATFNDILYFFQQKKRTDAYPTLHQIILEVYWDKKLIQEIDRVIDREKEMVKESASPELGRIRKQKQDVEKEHLGAFYKALRAWRQKGVLAEQEEGVRNGRRVLAVKAEFKRAVSGIYHDDSANGSIAFFEPNETVQLNNELASLAREEQREIERILRALTEYIRPYLSFFSTYLEILALYDAIRAKAKVAIELQATLPKISSSGKYQLINFRHPVLFYNYRKQKKQVVENSIWMDDEDRILLISGPNAGGKSVVLKSAGLLQLMLQFGMLIPAGEGSILPVFKQLFVDIGDAQSVENDLSTYSSHLRNMKFFTDNASPESFVLLDELGHGTDPVLGGAMAEAAMDYLLEKKIYAVVTTHYANLKAWGARSPGVKNAAMSFDKKHLQPLYFLQSGSPGSSFTFEIAAKSGINPSIIKEAKEKIGEQNKEMELSLSEIQHEKQYIKGIRKHLQLKEKQLNELEANYEQLKKNFAKEKKLIIKDFTQKSLEQFNESNRELEQLMREWKEDKQAKEKFLEARRYIDEKRASLEKQLSDDEMEAQIATSSNEPIKVGTVVRIEDGAETGVIKELRKNSALVTFGNTITHVKLNRLTPVAIKPPTKHAIKLDAAQRMSARTAFDINLDLRGLMKEEALTAMENFLDRAILFGCSRVRIIHGRGTGVLKQAVQHYLKRYPRARSYAFEPMEFGGDGVTAVELG